MQQAYAAPSDFAHFDLQLTDTEKAGLQELTIRRSGSYDSFGDVPSLASEAANYIVSLGTTVSVARRVARTIVDVTNNAVSTFDADAAWVCLRASLPHNAFDIPRWHIDGHFFRPFSHDQRKVVITLKGASTLFSRVPQGARDRFLECACRWQHGPTALEGRTELARIVNACGSVETAGEMQGTIFVVGDRDKAAIHSEPMIHSERLFLSILPGRRQQIRELQERWSAPVRTKDDL